MRITPIKFYTPQFKAHSYKIEPKICDFEIRTDNNPYLGEKPYLIYDDYGEKREVEMQKENGLYSAKVMVDPLQKDFKYHIKYQDTGKLDLKDGKEYSVDFDNLSNKDRKNIIKRLKKRMSEQIARAKKKAKEPLNIKEEQKEIALPFPKKRIIDINELKQNTKKKSDKKILPKIRSFFNKIVLKYYEIKADYKYKKAQNLLKNESFNQEDQYRKAVIASDRRNEQWLERQHKIKEKEYNRLFKNMPTKVI